jgi:MFS family permease
MESLQIWVTISKTPKPSTGTPQSKAGLSPSSNSAPGSGVCTLAFSPKSSPGILVNVSIFILGVIIQATAIAGSNGASNILAGRFITGMGVGSLSMIVPMYNAEIAPPEVRGALVGLQQLSITLGIMISFWIDYGTVSFPISPRFPLSLTCLPELHRRPRPQPEEQRLAPAPLSPTRYRRPPRRRHDIHAFFSPLARAP